MLAVDKIFSEGLMNIVLRTVYQLYILGFSEYTEQDYSDS